MSTTIKVVDGKLISTRVETKQDVAIRFGSQLGGAVWGFVFAQKLTGWQRKTAFTGAALQVVITALGAGVVIEKMRNPDDN